MKLHASGEDYLEAILVLQKKMGMVRPVDIARHMGFTKPSITHAITTLQAGGFVERDEDGFIRLTDVGREVAEQTYERHCFFTEHAHSRRRGPKKRRRPMPAGWSTLSVRTVFST